MSRDTLIIIGIIVVAVVLIALAVPHVHLP
jgi:hypothetical protein